MPLIYMTIISLFAAAVYIVPFLIPLSIFVTILGVMIFNLDKSNIKNEYMEKHKRPFIRVGTLIWLKFTYTTCLSAMLSTVVGLIVIWTIQFNEKGLIDNIIFICFQAAMFFGIYIVKDKKFSHIFIEDKGRGLFWLSATFFTLLWTLWQIYFQLVIKENWIVYIMDIRV